MKIALLSDTHCAVHEIAVPPVDLLLHAGDWTFRGTAQEVETFFKDIAAKGAKRTVVIAGNHDWLAQKDPERVRAIAKVFGIDYLCDESVVVDGIKIYGSPWQPEFCDWAFNLPRETTELAEKWAAIPEDTEILITHGPPLGILDMTLSRNGRPREAVGCADLMARVLTLPALKLHVFGHIHPGYGVYQKDGGKGPVFVNASNMDESYDPVNPCVVMDWPL